MREELEDPVRPPDRAIPILDYFVYKHFSFDHDELQRARLFVGIVETYFIVVVVATIYMVFLSPLPEESKILGAVLCLGLAAVMTILLFFLRVTGLLEKCCQMVIGVVFLALTIGTVISNGPSDSPVTQLFVVPPLLGFCLLGLRRGIIWTAIVLLNIAVLVTLEMNGVDFPQKISADHETETRLVVIIVGLLATFGMTILYEFATLRLRKERDIEHARYVYLANHDQLTHLANRSKFETVLTKTIRQHERREPGPLVALIYLDLDGFKPINDAYGHHVGDTVLRVIALRLKACLRTTDLVARQGGDEFTIILDQLNSRESIQPIVEKLLSKISEPIEVDAEKMCVTGSIGVSIYPEQSRDVDTLKRFADSAMYRAKNQQNSWCFYEMADAESESNPAENTN